MTSRTTIGFHRIGVVLAVPLLIFAAAMFVTARQEYQLSRTLPVCAGWFDYLASGTCRYGTGVADTGLLRQRNSDQPQGPWTKYQTTQTEPSAPDLSKLSDAELLSLLKEADAQAASGPAT